MKRTTCSACGDRDLDQFLDLGLSPVADAYTATADEISPMYPLEVAVCAKCKLVQLLEVLPSETLFGTGYSFYSSASAPLSAYHARYAENVLAKYGDLAKKGVVEIGCNDGDFLRHFSHLPHIGFDPALGPVAVAEERGLNIAPVAFGMKGDNRSWLRGAGIIIANHVLAHVEDVSDVLAGIAALCDDETIVMIEVQYLPDLLVNNAFDLVYHEHRNFFSLTSLEQAAGRHGLYVIDAELTDRQGGSIRVTLGKPYQLAFRKDRVHKILKSEMWLDNFDAYAGMQGRAERIRGRLYDLITAEPGVVAVYGAPAKATTLLNFCELTADELKWCEDTTKAKQGRYIPGTGILILPPMPPTNDMGIDTEVPDAYLLSAWNYAGPIMKANPGNRWIIPFPAPMEYKS